MYAIYLITGFVAGIIRRAFGHGRMCIDDAGDPFWLSF